MFAGVIYFTGFGLPKRDPMKAVLLFKQAAGLYNNPVAHYLAGIIYFEGDIGVTQICLYGFHWMMVAAESGWSDAMTCIGLSYCLGERIERDYSKAIYWLEKVAEKDDNDDRLIDDGKLYLFGNTDFELNLTRVRHDVLETIQTNRCVSFISPVQCLNGSIIPAISNWDGIRHIMIWDLLANKKSSNVALCQLLMATIYSEENRHVPPDYNKAMYWARKAAKNRSSAGCLLVGLNYERGTGIIQNCNEAMKWYKRAYEIGGDSDAIFRIGNLYYLGNGVKRDCKLALFYFEDMINLVDDGNTYYLMGNIYRYGKDGVPRDEVKAYECYVKAAESGYPQAATELGLLHKQGVGARRDMKKAHDWFKRGALMGCPLAQYGLGTMYYEGHQGKVDLDEALNWFKRSDVGGFELARVMITEVESSRHFI